MPLSYPRVMICTGEHSGDLFGARLAAALKDLRPDVRLCGLGGEQMERAGVRLLSHTTRHAVMGVLYPIIHAFDWARVYRNVVREMNREPPDIFVPIDNPGFNLMLAEAARERRIPVAYYVSPQVWAWRPKRIHRIARLVDRMMPILPFEKPLYDRVGVDCVYVGHPMLDYLEETPLDEALLRAMRSGPGRVIGILPGSRTQELLHTFPILCRVAELLRRRHPELVFHVAAAAEAHVPLVRETLAGLGLTAVVHVGRTREVMKGADLALAVSGTATLETAYYGTPMVVVYRTSRIAKYIVPHLLRVKHICLVNIIAGREVVPEFLRFDDRPRRMARAALRLLDDPRAAEECRAGLAEVRRALGAAGSIRRAAEAVLDCMERRAQGKGISPLRDAGDMK